MPSLQWMITVSQLTTDMRTEVSWKRRFLRKKLKYMVVCVFVVAVIFVVHQLFYFKELNRATVGKLIVGSLKDSHRVIVGNRDTSKWQQPQHSKLIRDKNGHTVSLRGSRDQDVTKYLPNTNDKFMCFTEKMEIDFMKINDDYCDCPADGSDEPGTNACNNGFFYCEKSSKQSAGINVFCICYCKCMYVSRYVGLCAKKELCLYLYLYDTYLYSLLYPTYYLLSYSIFSFLFLSLKPIFNCDLLYLYKVWNITLYI